MDHLQQTAVEDLVVNYTNQGKRFSAWNITSELRKTDPNFRHYEVRRIVHDLFNKGDIEDYGTSQDQDQYGNPYIVYNPNPNHKSQATVGPNIHPLKPGCCNNANTNNSYSGSLVFSGNTSSTVSIPNQTQPVTIQPPPSTPAYNYVKDNRGRLWISNKFTQLLEVDSGDTLVAYYDSATNKVSVVAESISNHLNLANNYQMSEYTVDKSGNIAIASGLLQRVVGKHSDEYSVSVNSLNTVDSANNPVVYNMIVIS
jgi:hypothetical protein